MLTLKQEYQKFLSDKFNGLKLKSPLFYNWPYGIRFDLQIGELDDSKRIVIDEYGNLVAKDILVTEDEYFNEIQKRSNALYEFSFEESDFVYLVISEHKYKKRKIKFPNFIFNQIQNLKKSEIEYKIENKIYEKNDIRNIAIMKIESKSINYKNILSAIANTDFVARKPRLDNYGIFSTKEIYFVNINKQLIFHMYDDRGLDILAKDKEAILPIYNKFNHLILDYDRDRIDKMLS